MKNCHVEDRTKVVAHKDSLRVSVPESALVHMPVFSHALGGQSLNEHSLMIGTAPFSTLKFTIMAF